MEVERGQNTCNCDTNNFFMCDMPNGMQDALGLRGLVNGQPTEFLPNGEIYRFQNTLAGTTAKLDLAGNGMDRTTFYPDLAEGVPLDAGDLQMFVGARDAGANALVDPERQALMDIINNPNTPEPMLLQERLRLRRLDEAQSARANNLWEREGGNAEAVFLLALHQSSLPEGEISADGLGVDDLFALSTELGSYFGVFWNDMTSLYSSMGGRLARSIYLQARSFNTTFSNVNELVGRNLSLADQVRMRGIFLREIFSARPARIVTHRGQKMVTFRGPAGNRVFLSRTAFPAKSMTVINANIVAGQTSAAVKTAAGQPFKGASGFFLIVGGIVEVVRWLALPESEQFLSDLFVSLGLLIGISVFSGVAATAAVLLGLSAAGVAAPVVLTGLAIGAVGLGIAIGAGWLLDWVGIREALERQARRFFSMVGAFARQILPSPQEIFYDPDWHPIQNMGLIEGMEYFEGAPVEEQQYILERAFGGN